MSRQTGVAADKLLRAPMSQPPPPPLVLPQELTRTSVFVFGLRKYAGSYALPPGVGLLSAMASELIVMLLLIVDREIAAVTGAFPSDVQEFSSAASGTHIRSRNQGCASEEGVPRRPQAEYGGATSQSRPMDIESCIDNVPGRGQGIGFTCGDDEGNGETTWQPLDPLGDRSAATGDELGQRAPHYAATTTRDERVAWASSTFVGRFTDAFPQPVDAGLRDSHLRRRSSITHNDRSSEETKPERQSRGVSSARGGVFQRFISPLYHLPISAMRDAARHVSGFITRLVVVDFAKQGASLYLTSFALSMGIMLWSLLNFSRLTASSISYTTRCFDPVSGAKQSISSSQFDAATVLSVLTTFAVIIADRAIYRIWRPPGSEPHLNTSGESSRRSLNPTQDSACCAEAAGIRGPPVKEGAAAGRFASGDPVPSRPSTNADGLGLDRVTSRAKSRISMALVLKLILHCGLVIGLHAHVFFGELPAWHCESECASSRMTCDRSGGLQFYYLMCCAYLIISARQVSLGPWRCTYCQHVPV